MIEIIEDTSAEYSFVLKTEGGHALLNSVVYSNKKAVKEVVSSLLSLKKNRNTFERKTNTNGKFLFSLKSTSGEIIGNSMLYQSEAGMENGIKNLINRIDSLSDSNQL